MLVGAVRCEKNPGYGLLKDKEKVGGQGKALSGGFLSAYHSYLTCKDSLCINIDYEKSLFSHTKWHTIPGT